MNFSGLGRVAGRGFIVGKEMSVSFGSGLAFTECKNVRVAKFEGNLDEHQMKEFRTDKNVA
jgi:hypothetical protein